MRILTLVTLVVGLFSVEAFAVCAPVTGPVPFSGNWIFTDGANFVGGELPTYGRTSGSFQITTWESWGPWAGQSYAGRVTFQEFGYFPGAYPYPYFSYPSGSGNVLGPFGRPGTVTLDGTLTLSMKAREEITNAIKDGVLKIPGVDPASPDLSKVCVSDIGMNVGRWNSPVGGRVMGGSIYLYLNDTDAAYQMRF